MPDQSAGARFGNRQGLFMMQKKLTYHPFQCFIVFAKDTILYFRSYQFLCRLQSGLGILNFFS